MQSKYEIHKGCELFYDDTAGCWMEVDNGDGLWLEFTVDAEELRDFLTDALARRVAGRV